MSQLLAALQNKNLSLKAKGLLAIMTLLEDQYTIQSLSRLSRDGIHGTHTTVQELIEAGYVERISFVPKGGSLPRSYLRVRNG